jgi:hypothetical protein
MKNRKIKIGLIAGVSGMVAIPSCNSQTGNLNTGDNQNTDSIKLEQRLQNLANTKYKKELSMGAMCYAPMRSKFEDYICPYCGDTIKEKYDSWNIYNISAIESIVGQIKSMEYDVVLDKREFCPHCSGKSIENPELIFKIRFSSNAEYHIVKSSLLYEYKCLLAFLSDEATYFGSFGEEHALHDNTAIIQKMTGLGKDLKIEK